MHCCSYEVQAHSQSFSMVPEFPLSLQTRDWTGREREMSTSTESLRIRGEPLMNDTTSGGTAAGAEDGIQLSVTSVTNACLWCNTMETLYIQTQEYLVQRD